MLRDLEFKKKVIAWGCTLVFTVLSFLFKEKFLEFLTMKMVVPIFIFPLVSAISVSIIFFVRWLLLFKNERLKANRNLVKPGTVIGVINGPSNVIAIEWSWLNPQVLIAKMQDGHTIRVHYTSIILYL